MNVSVEIEGASKTSSSLVAKSVLPALSEPSEEQPRSTQEDDIVKATAQQMSSLSIDPVASPEANSRASKKSSSENSPVSASKGPEEYQLKWIMWHEHKTPIITQNQNGPCPLIAIANILLLRGKMKLPSNASCITSEELLTHVANNIVESRPEVTDSENFIEPSKALSHVSYLFKFFTRIILKKLCATLNKTCMMQCPCFLSCTLALMSMLNSLGMFNLVT